MKATPIRMKSIHPITLYISPGFKVTDSFRKGVTCTF